ncbi:MAG: 50S ribosomal protein L4 [Bacteroidales bacterium]|nr:50S ribosomal protein L4 [Bacteroidales bacterium]MCR5276336.1 50S ribosomal protein L4 [Bacteroidales bacterium]
MSQLAVLKIDGTPSGKSVELDQNVFGIEPNDHAVYLDVVQYLANQRHGNSKTKDRSEIAHSTKKLGRQKGGGGARHGSLKAGIFVGGGRVFGPVPRFYHNKLNKKVKRLARLSALTYKAQDNAIILVEPFVMDAPKTKELLGIVSAIKAGDRKVLFVLPQNSDNIYLSSRNLPEVKVITVDEINTYEIMNANSLVLIDGVQDILAERAAR